MKTGNSLINLNWREIYISICSFVYTSWARIKSVTLIIDLLKLRQIQECFFKNTYKKIKKKGTYNFVFITGIYNTIRDSNILKVI